MIDYNPKEWFTYIFRFHKADTFRKLFPMIVAISVYSWLIAYLETEVWKLAESSHVRNLTVLHSLLGFVISLLLAFRSNTAYDRWWEGRKLWGSLVNSSRNFALKLDALLPADHPSRTFFQYNIGNYAFALKNHLRGIHDPREFLLPTPHQRGEDGNTREEANVGAEGNIGAEGAGFMSLSANGHVPNQIASALFHQLQVLRKEKILTDHDLFLLNHEMSNFTDVCGACERIKNTPIPFSYSTFLKKFIFAYVMTLPFGFVFSLGYYVIPVIAFIFYVLASLELIAEEIENPFGTDANDLPGDAIAATIRKNAIEILKLPTP